MKVTDSPFSLSRAQDRRKDRRQKMKSVAYLNVEPDNGGILLDLSEGGMCISVANPLAESVQIHFSLWTEEDRSIEGIGQVCWLSESGRSAGVRFLSVPEESRRRIRECMAAAGATAKAPSAAAAGAKPEFSFQPTARAEVEAPPEASLAPETREQGGAEPQTPLFFLPKKRDPDEVSPDEFSSQEQTYSWHGDDVKEDDSETVVAYRSAIASTTEHEDEEDDDEEDRRSGNFLLVATFCFFLLALGVAALVAYPSQFSQLRQFAVSLTAAPAAGPPAPEVAPQPRRSLRRAARRSVPSGPQRGSRPVRDVKSFYAPNNSQASFPAQVTGYDRQRWSGRRFVPTEKEPASPGASSANPPASASSEPASSPSGRPVGSLRVEGGLVEEGSVSPTFSPLNLDGQTLVSKPIVVEAVIGKDGDVKQVRLVSSPASSLAKAVVSAVKLWRYRPFYRNGQPVEFITRITFDFSLPNGNASQ